MTSTPTTTIQFEATEVFKRELEESAKRLNLSLSAYVLYLYMRQQPGADAMRIDRTVHEVFGKHGEVMRRLAK